MSFAYPWILVSLLVLPLLAFFRYLGNRHRTVYYPDGATLSCIQPSWVVRCWILLPTLFLFGTASLVVALARPRKGLEEQIVLTDAVDIILLVDVSSSMRAEDLNEPGRNRTRLEAAKAVMEEFIEKRPHDRIGLIAFAAVPYAMAPLTLDHNWLLQQVNRLDPAMLEDGTAIGSAVASAASHLRDSKATSKLVILLTDGENNAGSISPESAAQAAKTFGIKVYTIGAGTDGYVHIPFRTRFGSLAYRQMFSQIDELTLKEIARIAGARYFRARDHQTLTQVYGEIDRLEKTEIEVELYTQFEDKFMGFLGVGIVLLVMEKLLALTWLGRLPL